MEVACRVPPSADELLPYGLKFIIPLFQSLVQARSTLVSQDRANRLPATEAHSRTDLGVWPRGCHGEPAKLGLAADTLAAAVA